MAKIGSSVKICFLSVEIPIGPLLLLDVDLVKEGFLGGSRPGPDRHRESARARASVYDRALWGEGAALVKGRPIGISNYRNLDVGTKFC